MKTKNKASDAATYDFVDGESILADANVWLYLQPPAAQPAPSWTNAYSSVFSRLLRAKARPAVDALILSEYFNRYVRIEYEASWKATYPKFKDFRKSPDSAGVLQAATAEIEQILKTSLACTTSLADIDLPTVLGAVRNGSVDFNDALLIQICRINDWKLLTHDGDMAVGGIELLTVNKKLLQACT